MNPSARISIVISLISILAGCLLDDSLKHRHTYVPEQLEDGWEISSPTAEGMDETLMAEAYELFCDKGHYYNALALLVVRNDKLVFETYSRSPEDRERPHHVQSVTKSVTSLVFGIVREAGYFPDLDTACASIMPQAFSGSPDKSGITLRHLLTMRSGIAFDNDDFSVELHIKAPADPVAYILEKPMYAGPGEKYYYRDCDPHLLSALVHHVTGKTLEQWAILHLFPEIGITGYVWLKDPEGTTTGAYGIYLKPRDLARVGQLVLQHGSWNAVEVIPSAWIKESTAFQTETDFPDYDYGYYWWTVPELGAITAWGHGGNFIIIVPEKDLVIVMISLPDVDDDTVGTVLPEFIPLARLIKEACP
jgi:CubicO group peptidase (beta-lactamase class C family)